MCIYIYIYREIYIHKIIYSVLGGGHGRLPLRLDAAEEVRQDGVHPLLCCVRY